MLTTSSIVYSYKLWYNYLKERRKQVKGKCLTEPVYEEVNNCHERALVFMHKVIYCIPLMNSFVIHLFTLQPAPVVTTKYCFSFYLFRCQEFGLTIASSLYHKVKSQKVGGRLTVLSEPCPLLSTLESGLCISALSATCPCLKRQSGFSAGTLR